MTNRLPQNGNGKPSPIEPAVAGGIPLDAQLVRGRVAEILEARMAQPFDIPEVERSIVIIQRDGNPKRINVDFVRAQLEQKRWEIVGQLQSIGVDWKDGEFRIDEGQPIMAAPAPNQPPSPGCSFTLTWTPHGFKKAETPSGPKLVV